MPLPDFLLDFWSIRILLHCERKALGSIQHFRPHDKIAFETRLWLIDALFLGLTQVRGKVLTGHHPCHIVVHWCGCCIYSRYWSDVLDHRTTRRRSRRVASMLSTNALKSLLFVRSLAHTDVLVEGTASVSPSFSLARLQRRLASCSNRTRSSSRRTARESEPSWTGAALARTCLLTLRVSASSSWSNGVHRRRLVINFDNLPNSLLLIIRSSVNRHVDNLFSSSLPEILVHDRGQEIMGSEFQNPAGAAGVLTTPIDSQSPWQNGKTERAGQSFKRQMWDMDEECHIEGRMEFKAAIAECCGAGNRYCNQSGFSASQRVFGSSLRLPGSLFSDDPVDRRLLTADPYTDFQR